jgi:hypothetical protein
MKNGLMGIDCNEFQGAIAFLRNYEPLPKTQNHKDSVLHGGGYLEIQGCRQTRQKLRDASQPRFEVPDLETTPTLLFISIKMPSELVTSRRETTTEKRMRPSISVRRLIVRLVGLRAY